MNAIENKWAFVVSCVLLRTVEGVGTAVLTTVIFSTFPKLFPKSVGTLTVIIILCDNLDTLTLSFNQGLFELAGGFGWSIGPSLGGVLYQVSSLLWAV